MARTTTRKAHYKYAKTKYGHRSVSIKATTVKLPTQRKSTTTKKK